MKNNRQGNFLKKCAPAGISAGNEIIILGLGLLAAVLYSMIFIGRYNGEKASLYDTIGGKPILIEGAKMPVFDVLMNGCLAGFVVVIVAMIGMGIYHYAYHYLESRSIYLMNRLPSKWELHIRCLLIPIIGVAVSVAIALLMKYICFAIYMTLTPQQCLPY